MAEVGGGQPWEQLKLTWKMCREAPCEMARERGAAVVHGSMCYLSQPGGNDQSVFEYDSEKDDWSKLPDCPQKDFGLAVVNNLLTAVGGVVPSRGGCTNSLSSFNGSEWVNIFPPTPTKRVFHTVISVQNYLIKAGGLEWGNTFSTVEVMDMNTLEWSTAASLPEPVWEMSATVCGGRLYLLGGKDKNKNQTHAVFTCILDSLIRSCHPPSQTLPHTSEASVWQRVADIPVRGSTCTTLNGRVLAVGGIDSDGNPTAAVHLYDAKSDSWPLVGYMPTARDCCLVVALHNRIIAVGGNRDGRECSTVECGEVEMVQEEHFTFSRNEERTFDRRKGQGLVLHVPKGAVSSGDCTVEVKSRVVSQLTPEFIFPEGSKLISGVYHVTASRKLSKPVCLEIEHCSAIEGGSQHTQIEVATADSTTGPPYHFKPYIGHNVRVFDSYAEVKLAHFSFLGSFSRAIRKPASIRYCGLVCCLKSSELTRTWEYHLVLIRNLQLCIAAIRKEYATAESVQELSVEFEGDALTLDNVSVEGTTTSGGWHVATKWDPARVKKVEADNFTPGSYLPQCCVLATCTGEVTSVGALRHVLKFSGTQTPKSYLLCRDAQSERSTSVSSVDRAASPSTPTPEMDVSGVDDSPLGEQDLLDILSTTIEVAARWKHIGDAFRLSPGTLGTIRADCLDSKTCLREVILKWLQKSGYDDRLYGPPTWRWVVEAVGSPAGGDNPELARRIAAQHSRVHPGLQSGVTQIPPATPTDIMLSPSSSSKSDSSFRADRPIIPNNESKKEDCCCVVF